MLSQLAGVAAVIALAVAVAFTVFYSRQSSPAAAAPSSFAPGWSQAYFADANTGWFVARTWAADGSADHSTLYATSDGGRHWNQVSSVKGNLGPLWVQGRQMLAMQSTSPGPGQNLLQSSDHGVHWSVRRFPSGATAVQPFFLPDLRNGWLFDAWTDLPSKGVAWRTVNGGESWNQVATLKTFESSGISGSTATLTLGALAWSPSSAAVLMGQPGSSYSKVFVTHDSGAHWRLGQVPAAGDGTRAQVAIMVPEMLSDLRGIAIGTSVILYDESGLPKQGLPVRTYVLRTVDGASAWSVPQTLSLPGGATSASVRFLTDRRWIGIVYKPPASNHYQVLPSEVSRLYTSNDSGQEWQDVTPSVSVQPGAGWDVYFGSPDLGVASYTEGDRVFALFKTTDGGAHWQGIDLPK